jgi:hypothetical protein
VKGRRRTLAVVATLVASLLIGVAPAAPQPTSPTATEAAKGRACEKWLVRMNDAHALLVDALARGDERDVKKYRKKAREEVGAEEVPSAAGG